MSKKHHSKSNRSNSEASKPRNAGTAGFFQLEYRGKFHDHVAEYMRWKELWTNWVTANMPTRMSIIVKEGKLPRIDPIDLEALERSMPHTENRVALLLFESQVKVVGSAHAKDMIDLKNDLESYYESLWLQLALSMRNMIGSMKDYAERSETFDVLWLWAAVEAVCLGTVNVTSKNSKVSTQRYLNGLKKNKSETIHVYNERWKLAYRAYRADRNVQFFT